MTFVTSITLLFTIAAAEDPIVARVDGEQIRESQLRARVETARKSGGQAVPALLVEDLVNEALLAKEGYRQGLAKDPAVKPKAEAAAKRAAAELLKKQIKETAQVDDKILSSLYHSQKDSAKLRLVVFTTEDDAKASLQRLRGGGKLADEAKRSVDRTSAATKGEMGTRTRGQLGELLAQAAFAAPLDEWTGPVKLDLGYGVIQVLSREIGDAAGFEKDKEGLRKFAKSRAEAEFLHHYSVQLRKESQAKVDEAFLDATGLRLEPLPGEEQRVIASVRGRQITFGDVLAEMGSLFRGREGGHMSGPGVKKEFAWSLVDRALMEEAAVKAGLLESAEAKAAWAQAEREAVIRLAAAKIRTGVPPPSRAEEEAWYKGHPEEFRVPARRQCSHILSRTQGEASKLRKKVEAGEPFEEVAKRFSLDESTQATGGSLGDLTDDQIAKLKGSDPGLGNALAATRPGALGGPVEGKLGWHLVKCGPATAAKVLPLDEVRGKVAKELAARAETEAVAGHLRELRTSSHVTVDRDAVGRVERSLGK